MKAIPFAGILYCFRKNAATKGGDNIPTEHSAPPITALCCHVLRGQSMESRVVIIPSTANRGGGLVSSQHSGQKTALSADCRCLTEFRQHLHGHSPGALVFREIVPMRSLQTSSPIALCSFAQMHSCACRKELTRRHSQIGKRWFLRGGPDSSYPDCAPFVSARADHDPRRGRRAHSVRLSRPQHAELRRFC